MAFEKTQEQLDTLRNLTWQNGKLIEQNQQLLDQLENGAGAIGSEIIVGKQSLVDAIEYKGGESSTDKSLQGIAGDIKKIPNFNTNGCEYISEVYKPTTLLEAYYNRYYLKSVIDNYIEEISDSYTFVNCGLLQNVQLPNLITISGGSTFSSCFSLQSVELPNLITISGSNTFHSCSSLQSVEFGRLILIAESFNNTKENLRNITIGAGTDVNLPFQNWTATNVIAKGQSGIDELNSNLYNNLLTKLYDHSEDGEERTLRLGWYNYVSEENKLYAKNKGWNITT